jgi:hypothetical protein
MIHHSLTADSGTVSWAAIEKYHMEVNGWRDCGYHAGVERVADLAEYGGAAYQAIIGRPLAAQASACPQGGMNSLALHVCCVGNYDLAPPPLALLERLVKRVLLPWMAEFNISADHIVGHRDYNVAKTCPGKQFSLDMLRRMVR